MTEALTEARRLYNLASDGGKIPGPAMLDLYHQGLVILGETDRHRHRAMSEFMQFMLEHGDEVLSEAERFQDAVEERRFND